jgi:hypothetical protein
MFDSITNINDRLENVMDFDVIDKKLTNALQKVLKKDQHLLIHNINEPAISHRLAVYLESLFPDFNVDCEYNGNVDHDSGRKYIQILTKKAMELGIQKEDETEQDSIDRSVFPDIIIHKRGHNGSENNLLIIEVKKSSNQSDGAWDVEKLSRFTSSDNGNNFNYQYGLFVRFTVGDRPRYSTQWYQDGQPRTSKTEES